MIDITPGQTLIDLMGPGEQGNRRHRAFWRRADENGPNFIGGTTVDLMGRSTNVVGGADGLFAGKDASGNDVIPRYPLESNSRWLTRKLRSKCPSIVRHIVDHYVAHVFRCEVTRTDLDQCADEFMADCNGFGTPLVKLLRRLTRVALVERESYILIDTNLTSQAVSAADAASQGGRFVLRPVGPDQIMVLKRSEGGVAEAIIEMLGDDGEPFLWQVTATQMRKASLNKQAAAVDGVGPWQSHDYGACPLIAICELPRFVPPVAESQKRLAVLDSLLECELHAAAFSQPVFTGVDPKATMEMIRSNEYALAFPQPDAKAFMLGSDVAQAASIRAERDAELENAYREAKVSPVVSGTSAPESGIARAYRFVDADVELAAIAEAVETAERAVWAILENVGACAAPTVTYPRSFIPQDDAAELDKVLAVSASNLPKAIKKHFLMEYAKGEGLSDDEMDEVEAEIDDEPDVADQPTDPALTET